jgi:DNA topoisomerase-1
MKCKTKREMQDPRPVFTSNGTPATQGVCPVCGTKMFRMGHTPAHEGLDPEKHIVVSKAKAKTKLAKKPKMVIVESPAKARTVGRFLGKKYTVRASVGHVRDLLRSSMSVDVENDFTPRYRVPNEKRQVVKELQKERRPPRSIWPLTPTGRGRPLPGT